jgi:hypothetical protein
MSHQEAARIFLAIFCVLQGAGTLAIDLSRTHATHPNWLGHARFHVVWQSSTTAMMAIIEVALLAWKGPMECERFYLACLLASLPICGFFVATLTKGIYCGTLSDPGGMPPFNLRLRGRVLRIDLNVVAEILGTLSVIGLAIFYGHCRHT